MDRRIPIEHLGRAVAEGVNVQNLLAFHVALEARLRRLSEPEQMIAAGTKFLGCVLEVSQAGFGEVIPEGARILVPRDWTDGRLASAVGEWRLADLGPAFLERLRTGEPLVINDLHEARGEFPEAAVLYEDTGVRALMGLALVEGGDMVAIMLAHSAEPRVWSPTDVAILEVACERLWEAVRRARAESALRESQAQLSMALDAARMGTFDWDADTDRLELTNHAAELFGLEPGRGPITLAEASRRIHPEDLERHRADITAAHETSGEWRSEYRVVRPSDGKVLWIEERGRQVTDPKTGRRGMKGVLWDVTARMEAEERVRSTFAIQTVGVIYWNADFRLADVNEAFLRMTGLSREEALGLSWRDLAPVEFHADGERAISEIMTRGESTPYEKQYFRKGGSRWWGLFAGRKVGDQIVEFVLDVTERKTAEEELRRLNETLEARVAEEVAARLGAEEALRQSQKMEAIGQLTGGVAHDFNNLLTVIRSSADLLRRPDLTEERRRRYVEAIAETADRAAKLTGQLLAFARRQALKPEVFNISARVEVIADMLRTVVGPRIDLVTDTSCEICFVEADATQFETALVNMAVNARDAMPRGGRLEIKVQPTNSVPEVRGHCATDGAFVAVCVSDTGEGIPQERLGKIFEPFFTTKEVGKGTGLGLSQVYGFAKQSGGEVEVKSEVGRGSSFTLYLPRAPAPGQELASEPPAAELSQILGHVLVVEDNEQVGSFSTQLLSELGFETTWAPSGDAALKLVEADPGRYSAVFSDVVMPGMSGVDLGREIQRRRPDLPVVLTSGYSHVLASEGPGGFELLHKPYSAEELTRVLRHAMARNGQPN